MLHIVGSEENGFALLIHPTSRGQFNVLVSPQIEGLSPQIEVSSSKFRLFLVKNHHNIKVERIPKTSDLFVCQVTEEAVRELTANPQPLDRLALSA